MPNVARPFVEASPESALEHMLAAKRTAASVTTGVLEPTAGSPSKKRFKMTLPDEDVDEALSELVVEKELDFDVCDVLTRLLSGRYSVLTPSEKCIANNPVPLIATLWSWLRDYGFVASVKSLPPLKVNRHEKGFIEPFSLDSAKDALSDDGAGHYLTSINLCAINFFDLTDKQSASWVAIRSFYLHFFSGGAAVEFPAGLPLPCWFPKGIESIETAEAGSLPLDCVSLIMPPELCFAMVIGMFLNQTQSQAWERAIRSGVVHLQGNKKANQKHWRLNKLFQTHFDIPVVADNTTLTAIDQSDVIKHTIDHLKNSRGPAGRKPKAVTHKAVMEHYTANSPNAKHPVSSEKLVRNLTAIAHGFDGDHQSKEALVRMEMRHGRSKEALHMSSTKLCLLPQNVPSQHKSYLPEIIATIDCLTWRGQIVGGLAGGVTSVGLSGKNKRAGAEPTPDDTGLIHILLARMLIRDLADARFGANVEPKLRKMYQSIVAWEAHNPAEQTLVQAAASGVKMTHDHAWLNGIAEKDKLWKDFQHELMDGEYNDRIAMCIAQHKVVDAMPIIQGIEDLNTAWTKMCTAFGEAEKQENAERNQEDSSSSHVAPLFQGVGMPLLISRNDDDCLADSAEQEESKVAVAQAKLTHMASNRRCERTSFVVVPPTSPKDRLLAAVQNHDLYKQAKAEFGKRHVVVLVDPSKGPESSNPTKTPPTKASSQNYIAPRLGVGMELILVPGVFLIVWDGLRPENRTWISTLVASNQHTLKQAHKTVQFFESHVCLTFDNVKAGGLFSAPDWEHVSCHAVNNIKTLKTGQRSEHVGGRLSSSCVFPDQSMLRPADVPTIDQTTKQKIWPGYKACIQHLQPGSRAFAKEVDSRWRNRSSLVYANRTLHHLTALLEDLGAVKLVIDLTLGWGQAATACMTLESKPLCLSVANSDEHVTYVQHILDEHVLRAFKTPGHRMHDEVFAEEINEAFPNLLNLSNSEGDSEEGIAVEDESAIDLSGDVVDDDEAAEQADGVERTDT